MASRSATSTPPTAPSTAARASAGRARSAPARLRLGKHTEMDVEPVDTSVELDELARRSVRRRARHDAADARLFALLAKAAPTDATVLLQGETGTGKERSPRRSTSTSRRAKRAVRRRRLRLDPARADRVGAVRPREGRVHRRRRRQAGPDRGRERRHAVPRRDRRARARAPAAAPARARAPPGPPRRRDAVGRRRHPRDRRDAPRPARDGQAPASSARTSTTGSRSSRRACRRCASARPTSRRSRRGSPTRWAAAASRSRRALLEQLERHDWPGNVRELRNVVERALSLGDVGARGSRRPARRPSPSRATPTTAASADAPSQPGRPRAAVQGSQGRARRELRARLPDRRCSRATSGNISRAAAEAGIDRNYIHRLVKKYGLEVDRG